MTRPVPPPFDVAVVLGAAVTPDGRPGPALARRARHGAALVIAGAADYLLLSGGVVRHRPAEAEVMRAVALAEGVSKERLVLESASVNTLQNAVNSLAIVRRRGWQRVMVVTDAHHLPRALYTFRRLGLRVVGAAAPCESPLARRWPAWAREAAAFPGHLLRTEWLVRFSRRGG